MEADQLAMNNRPDESQLIRYLLGELPEAEKARIEDRLFADDDLFEYLQAIKAELADDYVSGALSGPERMRFEQRVLSLSEGRQLLNLAVALQSVSPAMPVRGSHQSVSPAENFTLWQSLLAWLRTPGSALQLTAAATLLLMIGGAWFIIETRRLRGQLEQAGLEREAAQRQQQELQQQVAKQNDLGEKLREELQSIRQERDKLQKDSARLQQTEAAKPSPASNLVLSFILSPGLIRGTDEPLRVVIPGHKRLVQLQLDLEGDEVYKGYRAELRTARGNLIWSQDVASARSTSLGRAVFLRLPADVLTTSEYELTLKGVTNQGKLQDVNYYYFSVQKK